MTLSRVGIYADSDPCVGHIAQFSESGFFIDQTTYTNIDEFLKSNHELKIAMFQTPYPYEELNKIEFEQRIDSVINDSDKIVVLNTELHKSTVDFIQRYNHPKIKHYTCGFIDGEIHDLFLDWLGISSWVYRKKPYLLDSLTPGVAKPKTFDILLGQPKPHRDFIYDFIKKNNFSDHAIMTYLSGRGNPLKGQTTDNWIWEMPGLELPDFDIVWTVTHVKYYGDYMTLSQIIPLDIYNQTAYTVVAETNFDNYYTFFTEKIVKPLIARRLFLVFSGQHYLRNLRSLGFKTFDGVIDESYDEVADHKQRFTLITEQMRYLIEQPQEQILAQIEPIVEHNYQMILGTDWYREFSKRLGRHLFT